MNFFITLIVALIIWVIGYWITKLSTREDLSSEQIFIQAPNWFYILCARPKGQDIPSGVMCLEGVVYQIAGLIMVLFAFIFEFQFPPTTFQLDRFLVGLVASFIIALLFRMLLIVIMPIKE